MGGLLVVISAPSGAGKTSVIKGILKNKSIDFYYSVSATTRPPRKGEVDGIDYYFLTEEDFKRKIENNKFIEWAQVHDCFYGTIRNNIEEHLAKQKVIVLDLDVIGGNSVRKQYPDSSLLIFITAPSKEVLLERLKSRGTDSETEIQKLLSRYTQEMQNAEFYDHIIINKDLTTAIRNVEKLIVEATKKSIRSIK